MPNLWCDLETFSPIPLKNGTHAYAEQAEVLLFSYAVDDGPVWVWDIEAEEARSTTSTLAGEPGAHPRTYNPTLFDALEDPSTLVWFHNGGMFDFVVLAHAMPWLLAMVPQTRRRDTLVQAFAHSLPGSLDKLGALLGLSDDHKKIAAGKRLVQLFCVPDKDGVKKATRLTHPELWRELIDYAAGDITTMREVHRRLPLWNYRGAQVDLWHTDMAINNRGFQVDTDLAHAAIAVTDAAKAGFSTRAQELTADAVQNVTQRDEMLAHILKEHGVALPDMQSATLERRLQDENLPETVKELLKLRLVGSMNSVSKYKSLLKGVSSDGRLRGCAQFRGAGRTGRYAHRLFQPGNLPRPTMPQAVIDSGIQVALNAPEELGLVVGDEVMQWASSAIRGLIVAPPGKQLVVADLSNIEGRVAAWLAGEAWKVDAFRDFDAGTGSDLYILAYAKSFNKDPKTIGKKSPERQIGKVQELMFQYGGGVGAWITGAATYNIDLAQMTEAVYSTLPEWAVAEATKFLDWMYVQKKVVADPTDPQYDPAKMLTVSHGLPEKVFVTCDAIKRLWRRAHPAISSFWRELEDAVKDAITEPGATIVCRKLKVRRDGGWLRIALPSGRVLCYPNPKLTDSGAIAYTGQNTYTRKWEEVHTYGGKLFENVVQAVATDQFIECFPKIETAGFAIVAHAHDEVIAESPLRSGLDAATLGGLMCSDLGWNKGLPLAAAGFSTLRYKKDD